MKYTFGPKFLMDLEHKMTIVADEPELQESYGITQEEIDEFANRLHKLCACREIEISEKLLPVVKGEMENMADIAWSNARNEGISAIGWATSIEKQLKKLG